MIQPPQVEGWYGPDVNALNFHRMPRIIGYPYTVKVTRKENMYRLFLLWEEMGYCIFVTIYPIIERKWVLIDKIYIDYDDEEKPEHALTDIRKVIRWANSKRYNTVGVYTGGKGYHDYILLSPQVYSIKTYQEEYELKCKLRAVAHWVAAQGWLWRYDEEGDLDRSYGEKNVESLRTADDRVFGDYRRFTRAPGFRYVKFKHNSYHVKDTYCQVVPNDILLSESHERIRDRCKVYNFYRPTVDPNNRLPTLDEFIEENRIKIDDWLGFYGTYGNVEYAKYDGNYAHPNAEIIKRIFPKPCIHQNMLGSDEPRHVTRFYVAVMLTNFYQWHPEKTIEFFRNLNLTDFSEEETSVQVYHIANRMPPYIPPSCARIKQWGLCVQSKCDDYRKTYEG